MYRCHRKVVTFLKTTTTINNLQSLSFTYTIQIFDSESYQKKESSCKIKEEENEVERVTRVIRRKRYEEVLRDTVPPLPLPFPPTVRCT